MKKILSLFAFACFGLAAFAQPVLTQSSFGPIGTTFYMAIADTFPGGISSGGAGASVLYDFSTLQTNDNDTIWILDPVDTPHAGDFPTSNIVVQQSSLNGGYLYGELTSNYFDVVGVAGDILGNGAPILVPQTPPSRIAAFPTSFGSSYSGTTTLDFTIDASSFGIPFVDSARYKNIADRMSVADGWGDLRIPSGTYPNVLRINQTVAQIDSIWIHSSFTGWALFQDTVYTDSTFTWWDETAGYNLAELEFIGGSPNTMTYLDNVAVASPEPVAKTFQLYPNPADQFLMISTTHAEGQLQLLDMAGKLVLIKKLSAGDNTVPTADLPAGQYIYRINDRRQNTLQTGKISVTH
mgnify:CR=1 FL=1